MLSYYYILNNKKPKNNYTIYLINPFLALNKKKEGVFPIFTTRHQLPHFCFCRLRRALKCLISNPSIKRLKEKNRLNKKKNRTKINDSTLNKKHLWQALNRYPKIKKKNGCFATKVNPEFLLFFIRGKKQQHKKKKHGCATKQRRSFWTR